MDSVAKTVISVGSRKGFCIDVIAFLNSGQILHRKGHADPGEVEISFKLSSKKNLFQNCKTVGGNRQTMNEK